MADRVGGVDEVAVASRHWFVIHGSYTAVAPDLGTFIEVEAQGDLFRCWYCDHLLELFNRRPDVGDGYWTMPKIVRASAGSTLSYLLFEKVLARGVYHALWGVNTAAAEHGRSHGRSAL